MEWRTVLFTALLISCGFLVIPIRVTPKTSGKDVHLFESYVTKYNKTYRHNPDEYEKRFQRFQKSLLKIDELNKLRTSGESAYYGPTEYSDLSETEFLSLTLRPDLSSRSEKYLNDNHHHHHHQNQRFETGGKLNRFERSIGVPPSVDWRTKGVITSVKSQGNCGACWAYSTIECVESMIAIKNGTLRSLSVQEMIDCAGYGNLGCNGGDICSLLSWLVDYDVSITGESAYPTTGQSDVCQLEKSKTSTVRVSDFTCNSYVDDENELLTTLANHGPVAAAVNALTWQNYLGGIIQFHCDGAFSMLNHAVQIVGYDNTTPIPHYIVRNSWGTLFGNKGYLYIAIGENMCGIANQVSSLNAVW